MGFVYNNVFVVIELSLLSNLLVSLRRSKIFDRQQMVTMLLDIYVCMNRTSKNYGLEALLFAVLIFK